MHLVSRIRSAVPRGGRSPGDRAGPGPRPRDPVAPARQHHHPLRLVRPRELPRGKRHRSRRRGIRRAVPQSRAATILDLTDLPIEPICYTDEEFAELVRKKNPFIHQALAEDIRV
ncbi:hypothetical protein BN140_0094 [Methanoculleus bourgensis MS2]|uniref:Uncharacterized protein n=1 Tax=Methanoculleus bourgensis (strain ATCC 43281 / DSM 3045 / OCM 15 / MS2) TaxID=1201294 RepID=I7LIJ1_METBM|nr:hypothetical protein BN140_0094 [Methanoculleus bourgensis MS2]